MLVQLSKHITQVLIFGIITFSCVSKLTNIFSLNVIEVESQYPPCSMQNTALVQILTLACLVDQIFVAIPNSLQFNLLTQGFCVLLK